MGRSGGCLLTPGVDGGGRKPYDGDVFRSKRFSRPCVRARERLYGEQQRVGCVRKGYNVPSGVGVRIDGGVVGTVTPFFDPRGGRRRGADRDPQTSQYLPYRLGRVDRAEDAHPAAATVAFQRIDGEYLLQRFRPVVPLGALFPSNTTMRSRELPTRDEGGRRGR